MQCTNCGNEIAMGSPVCTVCGAAAPQQAYDAQPAYSAAPEKKSKTGMIVGIIAAIVAVVAIVVILKVFVFGGNYDGTYVYDDFAAFGIEIELVVDGDKFEMTSIATIEGMDPETETVEGTIEFDGDKVSMTSEGETIEATYNKDDETITIEDSGIKMEFTKE